MLALTLSLTACTKESVQTNETVKDETTQNDVKLNEEIKTQKITIGDKEYEAEYHGKQDLAALFDQYSYREFWKVKDAYNDFEKAETTGNVLPYDNYPFELEENQIYIVQYTNKDESVVKEVHKYPGIEWKGQQCTEEILIEQSKEE